MNEAVNATEGPAREVRTDRETARGPAYGSVSRRRFDAPVEGVWQLLTDPERLRLWNPDEVTGEFRLGGEYSVKNNASGRVLSCEPPTLFRVSWIYQDHYSELEVRLGASGGGTVVEVEHLMREEDLAGAGMSVSDGLVAGGTGWDFTLGYLGRYLRGELDGPPAAHGDGEATTEDEDLFGESERLWQEVVTNTLEGGR